ncbi:MAG: ATP-dependent zinc metalloprotease FtsH [Planctomycetes bacterium]|nr:ATP-dependent zinc metalloprotease FtsH [Planctomycetota bacterium]
MVVLIVRSLNNQLPGGEDHTFQNVLRLAYQGDVEELKIRGDRYLDAKVIWKGRDELWDSVPIPEYAVQGTGNELAELSEVFSRQIVRIPAADAARFIANDDWRLLDGYTISSPRPGFTGVFVHYVTPDGTGVWAQLEGNRGDPAVTSVLDVARKKGVALRPDPAGGDRVPLYEKDSDLWGGVLLTLVPWFLFIVFMLFLFTRQMRGGPGGAGGIMSFGRSKVKMISPDQAKVTFDQVAGVEEAKEEVTEIIDFLKDPKRFSRLGGRIPKGVLLVGPPGTGKTLLAKAIAGEANVPFFAISGSDFVEMFVGVGASRVRDLFKQARENAPCVIFLDEIDAVGRKRGAGLGGGHDEREQTLNAMLVEMDGFEGDSGVIMIAATNRPDVLDPALLRPGRFDRQITLDLPDIRGREAILVVHAQKVVMSPDVDLSVVARGTPMFSGAELEALINEAALIATLKSKDSIEPDDLDEARDKVRFGRQKRSRVMIEEDKRVTAYHEAGHALVAAKLENLVHPVHKVTIIPRGMALGATMQLPERDKYHHRRAELHGMLAVLYGGRVAEELFCDDISGGASNDIERATEIARNMVCAWGMSDVMGPVSYGESRSEVFLGDELMRHRNYSEETSRAIDEEVRRFLDAAHAKARSILEGHRDEMERLKDALMQYETITGEDVEKILAGVPVAALRGRTAPGKPAPPAGGAPVPSPAPRKREDEGFGGLPVPGPA